MKKPVVSWRFFGCRCWKRDWKTSELRNNFCFFSLQKAGSQFSSLETKKFTFSPLLEPKIEKISLRIFVIGIGWDVATHKKKATGENFCWISFRLKVENFQFFKKISLFNFDGCFSRSALFFSFAIGFWSRFSFVITAPRGCFSTF